jgi:predicted RNase H-like HicB family nuclease
VALKNDRYTYRVTWSEEDNEHVGLCAEFPSLSWLAQTPEAALKGIRKVVANVVADLEANGEAIPEGCDRPIPKSLCRLFPILSPFGHFHLGDRHQF